ncbi:unnamed protein product [Enterobius vermicularis]|uniref:PhoH family protein n=1 Tax=Enterobius vermicularis TaxID=51028 RepID=A0A0N4V0G1_ENTVE|nr:unnamed protein product [Enterobius vermicularis]
MYILQEYADDQTRTVMMSTVAKPEKIKCASCVIPPNNRQAKLEFTIPYKEGATPEDTDILVKTWMNNDQVGLALHYIQQENQQEAWNLDFYPDSVSIGIPLIMHRLSHNQKGLQFANKQPKSISDATTQRYQSLNQQQQELVQTILLANDLTVFSQAQAGTGKKFTMAICLCELMAQEGAVLVDSLPNPGDLAPTAGDKFQLPSYTGNLPRQIIPYGHRGFIHQLAMNDQIAQVKLKKNYQSHPQLVEAISEAAYEGHLIPELDFDQRTIRQKLEFPGWHAKTPILFVQGREAVILITTRAGRAEYASPYQCGFLFDPQRTTVALSQAREGLFIIGDQNLLYKSEIWRRYLNKYDIACELMELNSWLETR